MEVFTKFERFVTSLILLLMLNPFFFRRSLLQAFRTASLRNDEYRQTTLTNIILRSYLSANLYEQAAQFQKLCKFPAEPRSPNELARFNYYLGRIKAIQLDYAEAYEYLMVAMRKAPHKSAVGFRSQVTKLICIVQMLMGDIPERSIFRQKDLKHHLSQYLELTKAVRVGELGVFKAVVDKYRDLFKRDNTLTLIQRFFLLSPLFVFCKCLNSYFT